MKLQQYPQFNQESELGRSRKGDRHSLEFPSQQLLMSKLQASESFKAEPIYAKPLQPGLGKRSLTQIEIVRSRENYPLPYIQHLPTFTNTLCQGKPIDQIVRKGLMWVQQDKLFSRWRERFIILTQEYLQFFKKGASKASEMGNFLYKVVQHTQFVTDKVFEGSLD